MQIVDSERAGVYHAVNMPKRLLKYATVAVLLLSIPLFFLYCQVDARAQIDETRRADAIIVLGSAVWPGGRPSPSLSARIQHAISLYRDGTSLNLILCGGIGGNPPSEAQVMRQIAVSAGVPEIAIVLDDTSRSTEESIAHAKQIMREHNWRTALIVSAPYHLLRAETIARDLGMEVYSSPAYNSPDYAPVIVRTWYTTREAMALLWYYGTHMVGEPAWLYSFLKGRI